MAYDVAGRTIWGFPKSIEQIDLDYAPDHVTCALDRKSVV